MPSFQPRLRILAMALPVAFVAHVVEEAPGFVDWINSRVTPGISQSSFLTVNGWGFVITLVIAGLLVTAPGAGSGIVGVAWVSFLMLANGSFHIVATVVDRQYCPGVITSGLLYLPLAVTFMRSVVRELEVPVSVVVMTALIGGAPMAVHGYLIVFRGSRLF